MIKKIFVFLILIVFFLSGAAALGVAPGRSTIQYTPGLEKTITFSVINSGNEEANIVVAVQGELQDIVDLHETSFTLSAGAKKNVGYTARLPQGMEPGLHTAEIVVLELPKTGELGETYIGAAVAVVTELHVRVPYPGKYAEGKLNIFFDEDDKIKFLIPVLSRGEFELVSVKSVIEVYTSLNEKVAELNTNEISIPAGQRGDLVAEWEPDVLPGPYRAVATVAYDGKSFTTEAEFNVGERKLTLENIEVNDFTLGDIAEFEMLVSNGWAETAKGVYAEMFIYNKQGELMAELKSPTYNVPSQEKVLMTAYWNTKGVVEGSYSATFTLTYDEGSEPPQELELRVYKDAIEIVGFGFNFKKGGGESNLMYYLTAAVVVLVLINLSWFVFLRKRFMKR